MIEIMPADIRDWITKATADGVTPATIRYCLSVLSAIFTTALNDQITTLHPCTGVRAPTVPSKTRQDRHPRPVRPHPPRLAARVPTPGGDRHRDRAALGRTRRTAHPRHRLGPPRAHRVPGRHRTRTPLPPHRRRFLVKHYPKDEQSRRIALCRHILDQLATTYTTCRRRPAVHRTTTPPEGTARNRLPDPDTLGHTEPNPAGTPTATAPSPPTTWPPAAANTAATPTPPTAPTAAPPAPTNPARRQRTHRDTDRHIPRSWFRHHIWDPPSTSRTAVPSPRPRPTPRPRLLAPLRRRRPTNRQRPHGPRPTHHHREIPPHPPPRRRRRRHRPRHHPQPTHLTSSRVQDTLLEARPHLVPP